MHGYSFFCVVFLFHSFTYSECLILGRGTVAPDPIPGIPGVRQEFILDAHYTHCTPTDADTDQSRVSNSLFTYCLCFYEVGGKRETQMKPMWTWGEHAKMNTYSEPGSGSSWESYGKSGFCTI